jgi:hypothetical protein
MKTYFFHSLPSKKGRCTIAAYINDKDELCFGMSRCRKNDIFIKSFGNDIALGRAIKNPIVKISIKPEISIGNQFIEACIDMLSVPVTFDYSKGSTQYDIKIKDRIAELV